LKHLVGRVDFSGTQHRQLQQLLVDRGEIHRRGIKQLLEAVDDKIGFLEGVDTVAGAHQPLQVKADTVGAGAVQAVLRLGLAGDNAAP
jgi:hypothetical protein